MVYLPTWMPKNKNHTIHAGEYASPMDPAWDTSYDQLFGFRNLKSKI